jgi:hypothetical protein
MTLRNAIILIDEIRKQKYKPNEYESKFMSNIETQKWNLSYKQSTVLNNIYTKAVGGGIYQARQR